MTPPRYPLADALNAQQALRDLAGLPPEVFSLPDVIGMLSDEIEQLRRTGHSDADIANAITTNSKVVLTAADIAEHYASPEERHPR